ncbi:MAG: STAS domain-containing protein [bacterium]
MAHIRITTDEKTGVTLLIPNGSLDLSSHLALKKKVRELIEDGRVKLIIDMSKLDSVDSSGIGTLVGLLNSARSKNGDIRLAGEIQPPVLDTLRLCGLTNVFRIYTDADRGIQDFKD